MLGSVLSRRLARVELFMGSRKLNQHKVLHKGNLTWGTAYNVGSWRSLKEQKGNTEAGQS